MGTTKEIGGHQWTTETFTGRESLSLFRTLTALAAEPISNALGDVGSKIRGEDKFDLSLMVAVAGGAIGLAGKIAGRLSDDELFALSQRLLKQTLCDNKSVLPQFDILFKGDVLLLLKVLVFVVEENFVGPFVSSLSPAVSTAFQKLVAMGEAVMQETSSEKKD